MRQDVTATTSLTIPQSAASTAIFVLGISQRSGTNFLYQLICLHPHCHPRWVYEDFLVSHSDLLLRYAESKYGSWSADWGFGEDTIDKLVVNLGRGLHSFLETRDVENQGSGYLVTKTPTCRNLDNYFRLFPQSPLIILVRDGRSVTESLVRGFHWSYERAMHNWADESHRIVEFEHQWQDVKDNRYLIVRYEDLYRNTAVEMTRILLFLDLPVHLYDFNAAAELPIIGSSFANSGDRVDFTPKEKSSDFDPLRRWSGWSKAMQTRFNWVAGDFLVAFGYQTELPSFSLRIRIWNHVLDARWKAVPIANLLVRWCKKVYHTVRQPSIQQASASDSGRKKKAAK